MGLATSSKRSSIPGSVLLVSISGHSALHECQSYLMREGAEVLDIRHMEEIASELL